MRILVVGAGGIGGYFGGRLAVAGADVTFLVRPRRASQLTRDGLVIRSPCGDLRLQVRTTDRVTRVYDLIILACKAYDLEGVIGAVASAVGNRTLILPLLNGLSHLEILDAHFGHARVLGGLCHIGVMLTENGVIEHLNSLQHLAFGARTTEQEPRCEMVLHALSCGAVDPLLSSAIMQDTWEKFVFLTGYAGITCLMRATIGAIAAADEGKAIALELLDECAKVADASGFTPRRAFVTESQRTLADRASRGTSSMLRDVLRGGRTDHDHILGDMLARTSSLGIQTPILRIARGHLQAYEAARTASPS